MINEKKLRILIRNIIKENKIQEYGKNIPEDKFSDILKNEMKKIRARSFFITAYPVSMFQYFRFIIFKFDDNIQPDLQIFDQVSKILKPYNYFIANVGIQTNDTGFKTYNLKDATKILYKEIKEISIQLEKVYEDEYFNYEYDNQGQLIKKFQEEYYYHFTPVENLDNILKKGLIPKKSKQKNFDYPERIYLLNNKPVENSIADYFKQTGNKQRVNEQTKFAILKVKVPKEITKYIDKRTPEGPVAGIYILEPISPQNIELIEIV